MNQAQMILEFSAQRNLGLDEEDVRLYLANCAALVDNPNDPESQRVAKHFEILISFNPGSPDYDFLNSPECPHDCPECRARNARQNKRTLDRFAALGLLKGVNP